MSLILLTGMTSNQVRERDRNGDLTDTGRSAARMRSLGHDVVVAPFNVADIHDLELRERYDRAIVGIAPLRGLASSYMYGALAAVHLFGSRCETYIEDGGGRNTRNDLRSIAQRPRDLVDPFFHYKRGWHIARRPEVFPDLSRAVACLVEQPDPIAA